MDLNCLTRTWHLTNGAPSKMSEMLALNIYNTFYGRTGYEGVGQSKAVVFFIIVGLIALIQNKTDNIEGGAAVMGTRKAKHGMAVDHHFHNHSV